MPEMMVYVASLLVLSLDLFLWPLCDFALFLLVVIRVLHLGIAVSAILHVRVVFVCNVGIGASLEIFIVLFGILVCTATGIGNLLIRRSKILVVECGCKYACFDLLCVSKERMKNEASQKIDGGGKTSSKGRS